MPHLVLTEDVGGQRHFLDERPVHCGDFLFLRLRDGNWLAGRYEASLRGGNPRAMLFTANIPEPILLNGTSELRWPMEREV